MYMWRVTNKITFQGFFKRVWRMSLYVSIHECAISPKMRDCFPEFSTFNINFSYVIQRYLKNSKWFSELPYLASKSNFRNLLVIKVQDKGIRFLPWSGFITNSEVCTKVNINLWNLDITGQNLPVSIVLEGQCGFMLFYTWKICTLVIHNYGVVDFSKKESRTNQLEIISSWGCKATFDESQLETRSSFSPHFLNPSWTNPVTTLLLKAAVSL